MTNAEFPRAPSANTTAFVTLADGHVVKVTIHWAMLARLAHRAARNKSRRATSGLVTVEVPS